MNGSYFNSGFPGTGLDNNTVPNQQSMPNFQSQNSFTGPIEEQSYIENILRLNKGKKVTIHMTFPDSEQFKDREFIGILEESGRDHIIISDPNTGKWFLLLMIYVDFITFDEKINYSQEFIPNN